jgi:hypothetical protein
MTRVTRWAVPALLALIPFGVALPVLAQAAAGGGDNRAKEIATMIEGGQLNLADATQLAERHAKGIALRADCQLVPAPQAPAAGANRGASADQAQPAENRLVYTITCFVKDQEQVQTVRVDGRTKKVIEEGKQGKTAAG